MSAALHRHAYSREPEFGVSTLHRRYTCAIASGLPPQQFNLTVLSADLDDSDIPVINSNNVLWIGHHGSAFDVYRYISTNTGTKLTDSTIPIVPQSMEIMRRGKFRREPLRLYHRINIANQHGTV